MLSGLAWGADEAPPPTRIKKKDGSVIVGEIKGVFVQGHTAGVKEGGYGALLYVNPGNTIAAIDEDGVHYRKDVSVRYVNVGQKKTISLQALASMVAAMDGGNFFAMMEYSSRHDNAAVKTDFLIPDGAAKLPILGEFRADKAGDKLIPALEIVTGAGTIVLPLQDIIPFKPTVEPGSR
jgi:hypothetical protein